MGTYFWRCEEDCYSDVCDPCYHKSGNKKPDYVYDTNQDSELRDASLIAEAGLIS
jgi:hypothetical protein